MKKRIKVIVTYEYNVDPDKYDVEMRDKPQEIAEYDLQTDDVLSEVDYGVVAIWSKP